MAKSFPLPNWTVADDYVTLASDYIDKYKNSTNECDIKRVKINRLYLQERAELMKTHLGKYVFVSPEKIIPTEFTKIEFGFHKENQHPIELKDTWGVWFKVGDEYGAQSNAFLNGPAGENACLPISFGERGNHNIWFIEDNILVDTGCSTTTFHLYLLDKIREIYPSFPTSKYKMQVIGGIIEVDNAKIDIDFCGKQYSLDVNFANIPYAALIGMDLIRDGSLFYEANRWISFTRH